MLLVLKDVVKDYEVKDGQPVQALKGVSLEFPDNGLVSILGQSGCGKTTLLNIIGGLDQYTSGDIIINGLSTKDYDSQDWDNYRNHEVGMVFQSYNLIPHLSVLGNVELAMTLDGVSFKERSERAKEALRNVGLEDQIDKKPNQLSGGQMQRVAIARALVNKPNIILADEPTGALDSKTSLQVMDILKETSKTKLVIMVTHNEKLAQEYSSRIIVVSDGKVISDSVNSTAKATEDEEFLPEPEKKQHTSMSYKTAIGISGKNLLTKKGRTIVTSVAASFGIIGVGLVLALSNGFTNYINRMESETLTKFPITIEKYGYDYVESSTDELDKYPADGVIHVVEPTTSQLHVNNITSQYIDYLNAVNTDKKTYAKFRYNYSIGMRVISKYSDNSENYYSSINTAQSSYLESMSSSLMGASSNAWKELPADEETVLDSYDIISGEYSSEELTDSFGNPDQKDFGLVLVVNNRNALTTTIMEQLGLNPNSMEYNVSDLTNKEKFNFQYVTNDDYYGEPIANTDAEGNPSRTQGIFFKDDVAFSDISSSIISAFSSSDENALAEAITALSDKADLPTSDELQTILNDSVVAKDITDLSTYVNTTMLLLDYMAGKFDDLSTVTVSTVKSYFRENKLGPNAVDYEANRQAFAQLLEKTFNDAMNTEVMKAHCNKSLSYFKAPTTQDELKTLYENKTGNNRSLHIACVIRPKEGSSLGLLSNGIYYPKSLTYQTFNDNASSAIAKEFKNHFYVKADTSASVFEDVINAVYEENATFASIATPFADGISYSMLNVINSLNPISSMSTYMNARLQLGSDVSFAAGSNLLDERTYASFVSTISIYPTDFTSKTYLTNYLNAYNTGKADSQQIVYTDVGQVATDTVGQIVDVISVVLIVFASISLVVSSVMLAILIYSSVVERTKEIGILRSIGARKKDVGRLFKAEGIIIGVLAGLFGVLMTYLISLPISAIINLVFPAQALGQICLLNPLHALLLVVISAVLTYLASLFPARFASNKDPVTCLRSE
ncbi:MAG: ATP-binding cassette domain-containing protein [Bacilli bacterium]